jgi:hypothetical protein
MTMIDLTSVLASALRGETDGLQSIAAPADLDAFLSAAAADGVEGLVHSRLCQVGPSHSGPAELRERLDVRGRWLAMRAASRQRELMLVIARLADAQVDALVFKGAALAHTVYAKPYLRPSIDIDLLVRRSEVDRATRVLAAMGYTAALSAAREPAHMQKTFRRQAGQIKHVIDLHWAISNRPLFGAMFSFEELTSGAVPLPAPASHVLTPNAAHALALACIHRVAHHNDSRRLIWLADVQLLSESMSDDEWRRFWSVAREKQLVAVSRESLDHAATLLGSAACAREARAAIAPHRPEPSAVYLSDVASGWRSIWLDVRHTHGMSRKLGLIGAHAFPDPQYMRDVYGVNSSIALAGAYMRRATAGWNRWRHRPQLDPALPNSL